MINEQETTNAILFAAEILDSVTIGIRAILDAQCDPSVSAAVMEKLETAKASILGIRKTIYMLSDLENYSPSCGYYNVLDFMAAVCKNLNNHISGLLGVEIEFEENEDDNINMAFDGRVVEKAIYDIVYNLICTGSGTDRKITLYTKSSDKFVEFCARSNFPTEQRRRSLSELNNLFPGRKESIERASYADIAAKLMGGQVKCHFCKNLTRMEMCIPKDQIVSADRMREQETVIRCGERVMIYEVCSKGLLNDFFAKLIYKTDEAVNL